MKNKLIYVAIVVGLVLLVGWMLTSDAFSQGKPGREAKVKPDTTVGSVLNLEKWITDKQQHLKQAQDELARVDNYRKQVQDEITGTAYQVDLLQKMKAEADSLNVNKLKPR